MMVKQDAKGKIPNSDLIGDRDSKHLLEIVTFKLRFVYFINKSLPCTCVLRTQERKTKSLPMEL